MDKEDSVVAGQATVQVRLEWGSMEHLDTVYVNHLFISRAGPEFYLVFGELVMPVSSRPEDVPERLEIVPRVRLAATPEAMGKFAKVIQEFVERLSKKGAK